MGVLSGDELDFLSCFVNGGICKVRMDDDFTLLYGNDEFYRIYGYSREEMKIELGCRLVAVIDEGDIGHISEVIGNAYANHEKSYEFEKHITRRDGSKAVIYTKGTFASENGETVSYNVIADITEQKRMEAQHRLDEQRVKIALEQTADLIFDYDIQKKALKQTSYAAEIYGADEYIENVPESLIEKGYIHEDHIDAVRNVFKRIEAGDAKASCVVKVRNADGIYIWNRMTLSALYDEQKAPVKAVGVLEDISVEKEAELSFVKEERYRKAMIPMSVSYAQVNITRDTVEEIKTGFSRYQEVWDGESYEKYLRSIVSRYVHIEEREKYLDLFLPQQLRKAYEEGKCEIRLEHRRIDDNGRYVWLAAVMYLLEDPFTDDLKGLFYLRDIDKEKQEEMKLKYQSRMDSLTMLYNKRNFEEQVKKYLSKTEKRRHHTFLILDVDDFKRVNDTYGHMFGDQVLKQIAGILRENLRSVDIVGRIGGDEYAVFLKDSGEKEQAEKSAQRIGRQIEEAFGKGRKITGSIGAAMYPEDGESFEELYQNADVALYRSKKNGKGCITFYDETIAGKHDILVSRTKIDDEAAEAGSMPGILDISIADEIDDAIYICDPLTYEMKYANKFIREQLALKDDYIGQKCYKVLQGLEEPCPFCTNKYLRFDQSYTWEHKNNLIGRQFSIKDKLIMWQGSPVRFEYAVDITEKENTAQHIKDKWDSGHRLISCIWKMIEEPDLQKALQIMVRTAANVYKGDRAYIFGYDDSKCKASFMEEWCREGIRRRKDMQTDSMFSSTFWAEHLKKDEMIYVDDIEEIKIPNVDEYKWMSRYKVHSFGAVSYSTDEQASGFIVVENPSRSISDLTFLKALSHFTGIIIQTNKMIEELKYAGYHDSLTGLQGRNGYDRWISVRKDRYADLTGLIVLDLNWLKEANERYGHVRGDQILVETSQVLKKYFEEENIFRLNGDTFIAVCEDISREDFSAVVQEAEKELETVGYDGAACGSVWSEGGADILKLQGIAEERMISAKQLYHRKQKRRKQNIRPSNAKVLLEELRAGYYYLYLQPKVNMETGEVIGAEALARYTSPDRGEISPDQFIRTMESERLTRYLDLYMVEETCRMLSRWEREGRKVVPVALNLSRLTLEEDQIAQTLKMILNKYKIPAEWIDLEITENIGGMTKEALQSVIRQLQKEGFRITLDDFGMKYMNTAMLAMFDLQTLKIDKSLIQNLESSKKEQAIIRHICDMCEELRTGVIAEGIEKEEQMLLLKKLGCRNAQGYYFGRPMPPEEFIEYIQI